MPGIYLRPSTRSWSTYITGNGSEEYHMNLLADHMIPYLQANAIRYTRNTPGMTGATSVARANQGDYDFYLALDSTASKIGSGGKNRGIIVSYVPGSSEGQRAAELIADHLRSIYPFPNQVRSQPVTELEAMYRPKFPAVQVRIGYHDNMGDAVWTESHFDAIAQQLVRALTDYFGLPFFYPLESTVFGTVSENYAAVNLMGYPSASGPVLAGVPAGAAVTVYGQWYDWYSVRYEDQLGYIRAADLNI